MKPQRMPLLFGVTPGWGSACARALALSLVVFATTCPGALSSGSVSPRCPCGIYRGVRVWGVRGANASCVYPDGSGAANVSLGNLTMVQVRFALYVWSVPLLPELALTCLSRENMSSCFSDHRYVRVSPEQTNETALALTASDAVLRAHVAWSSVWSSCGAELAAYALLSGLIVLLIGIVLVFVTVCLARALYKRCHKSGAHEDPSHGDVIDPQALQYVNHAYQPYDTMRSQL